MINFRLAELRKRKGITQQELGDALSVSFQTISRWENGVVSPDITMLPKLSQYFGVSVDALLGLVPLDEDYQLSHAGTKEYWNQRKEYLKRTRKAMWNEDYIQFLIERVWRIEHPVTILDCGCGYGALGLLLLPMLPEGSKYVGMDYSEVMLEEAAKIYKESGYQAEFILSDILEYNSPRKYDIVISQAVIRHIDNGEMFLQKMLSFLKPGGLLISMECNREFEADGLYINGLDYGYLCEHDGLEKLWAKELEMQNRDYSIAMKIPHYLKKSGLVNIGCRLNDKVTFLEPEQMEYEQEIADMIHAQHWGSEKTKEETEKTIAYFMNHGMNREEAEKYCKQQRDIVQHFKVYNGEVSLTKVGGMMISYGWKKEKTEVEE